jgi:hypothetical protein
MNTPRTALSAGVALLLALATPGAASRLRRLLLQPGDPHRPVGRADRVLDPARRRHRSHSHPVPGQRPGLLLGGAGDEPPAESSWGPRALFTTLLTRTQPRFQIDPSTSDFCRGVLKALPRCGSPESARNPGGGVNVVEMREVGPFATVILESNGRRRADHLAERKRLRSAARVHAAHRALREAADAVRRAQAEAGRRHR